MRMQHRRDLGDDDERREHDVARAAERGREREHDEHAGDEPDRAAGRATSEARSEASRRL